MFLAILPSPRGYELLIYFCAFQAIPHTFCWDRDMPHWIEDGMVRGGEVIKT